MAIGIMKGLKDLGLRVPSDMSVIGMDNLLFSEYVEPPLTSIRQPKRQKGVRAMLALINMIEHPEDAPASDVLLPTELVERASTAPPIAQGAGSRENDGNDVRVAPTR